MTTPHQVRDGSRLLTFEGDLLGCVSSRRDGAPRWTEMSIYKTHGTGSYVLEKVGLSVVTHVEGCPGIIDPPLPRFQEEHPGADPDDGFEYDDCVPEEYDFTKLLVERTRYWSTISDQPDKIVDALYRLRDGVRTMPRISLALLEDVSKADPSFGEGWRVEVIY